MARMKILTFPDPRLREPSIPVKVFTPELKKLAQDMIETMVDARGIGLAAPQVGQLLRMIVIDTRPRDEKGNRHSSEEMTELEKKIPQPLILINPEIVKSQGKTTYEEGCLSVPSFYETVERNNQIEIRAQDLEGRSFSFPVDGLLAICIQHEMDHLEGVLFIDHLSVVKSNKIKTQIKKHGYPEKKMDLEDEPDRQKL